MKFNKLNKCRNINAVIVQILWRWVLERKWGMEERIKQLEKDNEILSKRYFELMSWYVESKGDIKNMKFAIACLTTILTTVTVLMFIVI